jgi:hypothetical protein
MVGGAPSRSGDLGMVDLLFAVYDSSSVQLF